LAQEGGGKAGRKGPKEDWGRGSRERGGISWVGAGATNTFVWRTKKGKPRKRRGGKKGGVRVKKGGGGGWDGVRDGGKKQLHPITLKTGEKVKKEDRMGELPVKAKNGWDKPKRIPRQRIARRGKDVGERGPWGGGRGRRGKAGGWKKRKLFRNHEESSGRGTWGPPGNRQENHPEGGGRKN